MTRKKKICEVESEQTNLPTTFREISNLTNGVLNSLLKKFGHSTKGKRNHKITVLASQLNISTTGSESDPFLQTLRQVQNLKHGWTTDIRQIPEIKLRDITSYLIAAHDITVKVDQGVYEHFSVETLKRYKALRSYDLWESGHISAIKYNELDNMDSFCAVKCSSNPSGDSTGTQYDVVVILDIGTGKPVGATCSCVAGLGEACTHVAGLLFAMEDFVSRGYKDLPTEQATTEKLCKWIVPKGTEVMPRSLKDVPVTKPAHGKRKKEKLYSANNFNPVPENKRDVSYDDLVTLKHTLSLKFPNLPWVTAVAPAMMEKYRPDTAIKVNCIEKIPEIVDFENPVLIPAYEVVLSSSTLPLTAVEKAKLFLSRKEEIGESFNICNGFTDNLKWTEEECNKIEEITQNQASSAQWMLYRKGIITASNFQRVASRVNVMRKSKLNNQTANAHLISDLVNGSSFRGNESTEYGKKSEDKAVNLYKEKMKGHHKNFQVVKCGLFIHKDHGFLGATPDRIVNCNCHGKMLLEVKCPKSLEKGGNPDKMDYIVKTKDGKFILKESNQGYYAQVQGQMAVTGVKRLDFLLLSGNQVIVINVKFNHEYWKELYEKLHFFHCTFVSPSLLNNDSACTSRSIHSANRDEISKQFMSEVCEATSCYPCGACGKQLTESESIRSNSEASVGCDCDCQCKLWFHWNCVNYDPTEEEDEFEEELKWFCPGCVRNCDIIY